MNLVQHFEQLPIIEYLQVVSEISLINILNKQSWDENIKYLTLIDWAQGKQCVLWTRDRRLLYTNRQRNDKIKRNK